MAYVTIPKDLTKVKSKVLFGLTKRQLICFGAAALIGVPLFFLLRRTASKCSPFQLNLFVQGSSPSVLLLHLHRRFQSQGSLQLLPFNITHIHSIFHSLHME